MAITEQAAEGGRDFIRDIVQADLDAKKYATVVTRSPPEPNGRFRDNSLSDSRTPSRNMSNSSDMPDPRLGNTKDQMRRDMVSCI